MNTGYKKRESLIGQDGFSVRISEPSMHKAEDRKAPDPEAEQGRLVLADNGDGSLTVVRCLDLMADDLDLVREAGNRPIRMIAARAFQHCGGIRRVVLPEGLLQIGEMAFLGCAQLQRVEIPGSVERIGTLAFARCQKLTHVRLQPGILSIGPSAFQKCPILQRVDVPESVVSFGSGLFLGCPNVVLYGATGSRAEQYAKANGIRFDSEGWREDAILNFHEEKDGSLIVTGWKAPQRFLEIPREICGRKVAGIAPRAFSGCQDLEGVRIDGAEIIGEAAFLNCRQLVRVILERGVREIGPGAFAECIKLPQITLPYETGIVRRMAFQGCMHLTYVKMPRDTRVEEFVFDGCSPALRVYGGISAI